MAKIIVTTEVKESQKFGHTHKGIEGVDSFIGGFLFSSKYCPECGEYLQEPRSLTFKECSNCGERLLPLDVYRYKFCPGCGEKFED